MKIKRFSTSIEVNMVWFMVLNIKYATFNNISALSRRSDLSVEETGVPRENHRPVASLHLIMFYQVHHARAGFELTTLVVIAIGTDCTGSWISRPRWSYK